MGLRTKMTLSLAMVVLSLSGLAQTAHVCECGAHPPGPPPDRALSPYAGEPTDMSPFAKFASPYDTNYIHPNVYLGAGRDIPDPIDLNEIRIGVLAPMAPHPQQLFGTRMLHGAQLAVEEANARGGYGGKPFRLMPHNDYDNWQANTVYGDTRPTNPDIWGSASDEVVKMVYDEKDWAIFGSISSESTHIALRVALRAEIPIVNSASTDPTIPETYIPWYFTDLQDDRVQSLTLARHIFTELGLKRVALLRVNERYGRLGVPKFRDAARRLGHPVVIEQKYLPGDKDFSQQLKVIASSRVDAIVLWADEIPAALILKQIRAAGMKQRVFGAYRTLGPDFLKEAGKDAEGFEAVFPYDPNRQDPMWVDFNRRFESRFQEKPDQFASLAFDAMNALLDSICKAGLNRARIHDALANIEQYDGVTGHMIFDPNQKNIAPMYLGTVHQGAITYRPASMEKTQPYARVGEDGIGAAGPRDHGALPAQPATRSVILFGKDADSIARSPAFQAAMRVSGTNADAWQVLPIATQAAHQDWGNSTSLLVESIFDKHALAIIALDRNSAHLAEQLALKAFVPVLALSSDQSLTSTNVPWIFRLPAGTDPVAALRLVQQAVDQSGPAPSRLRERLASGEAISGVAFLPGGEPRAPKGTSLRNERSSRSPR